MTPSLSVYVKMSAAADAASEQRPSPHTRPRMPRTGTRIVDGDSTPNQPPRQLAGGPSACHSAGTVDPVVFRCDYLVIGGGLAGLTFALHASKHGRVALVTKKSRMDANTAWAQ